MVVVPFMGESIEDGSLIAVLKRKWLLEKSTTFSFSL